ncbi:ABC transporter substrate-binding protein [Halocalculus aciditolerans]|nr:ABC transporter substrate-binding protein [Halocalculus aciditolerans]
MTKQTRSTRRRYLQATGGALGAAGLTALAGCSGGGGSTESLSVAYMPIYPDMQHFVMEKEGYYDALDADVEATEFSDGPSIVQAYATGDYDVALFGVVPAMIVIDKTGFAKVTAANIQNAMQILARDEFAAMYDEQGKDAFAAWEAEKGEKFTFGTFPPGSVPDILLRYWLEQELGLDPGSDVNIESLGGAGPVRQALAAGKIDGTSIMEPVPTIANEKGMGYSSIAWAGDFMPGQPAAVTMMHDDLRNDRPELAKSFLEQHKKATAFTENNPDAAAKHASDVIGSDALPVDLARKAMDSPASDFISNPHQIESGTETFAAYANRLGKTSTELSVDQIFDYSLYDSVSE